jgi:hypothetical protein
MSGCITVGALEVTLCAGTTNTTDLSGNTTIIYAFFNTSDTDDEYSLPGCHLDAHWPSNVSDIYFNDDCLTDGSTSPVTWFQLDLPTECAPQIPLSTGSAAG